MMSVTPPGAKGTISVMVFAGYFWLTAGDDASPSATIVSNSAQRARNFHFLAMTMLCSPHRPTCDASGNVRPETRSWQPSTSSDHPPGLFAGTDVDRLLISR